MSLKDIKGNEKLTGRLMQAVKSGNISHAYIFEGDSCISKLELAENFVKAILCEAKGDDCCEQCSSCNKINHGNHEDLIYLKPEGNSIKDEAVEEVQSRIKKKPYVGERNVVIIEGSDTMTLRAQNRLLKTLEEPSSGTVIILLSENIENLAQTILSRCIIYKFNSFHSQNFKDTLKGAIEVANLLLEGRAFYEIAVKLSEFAATKETAYKFLDALESWYRDIAIFEYDQDEKMIFNIDYVDEIKARWKLYNKNALSRYVMCIEEARNDLNINLNINYTLKNMILKIVA